MLRIKAAGKTWIVEQREVARSFASGRERFSGVTFRNEEQEREQLHVRWVMRPASLTPRLAHELFEIAGVRIWQDPRDARRYCLQIESGPGAPGEGRPASVQALRFQGDGVAVQAPWTLGKPLGWASDGELMTLLDDARQEVWRRSASAG